MRLLFGQPAGALGHGAAYRLVVSGPGGTTLPRRDPWARSTDPASSWCFAHSPAAYTWQHTSWEPLSYDKVGMGGLTWLGAWYCWGGGAGHYAHCLSVALARA